MTDTGQIPGEGLPEHAVGDAVLQPHADLPGSAAHHPSAPAWGADPLHAQGTPGYTFLDQPPAPGASVDEEDDLLLMPGPQGSWSDPQPVPAQPMPAQPAVAASAVPAAEPEASSGEGAHESGGRNSGSADYTAVRVPSPASPIAPETVTPVAPGPVAPEPVAAAGPPASPAPASAPAAGVQPPQPRRPLHMGPPLPDPAAANLSVRSLADRGPTPVPVPAAAPVPARTAGPPTTGPEYFEVAQDAAMIPAQQTGEAPQQSPAPQPGAPLAGDAWSAAAPASAGGARMDDVSSGASSPSGPFVPSAPSAIPLGPSAPAVPAADGADAAIAEPSATELMATEPMGGPVAEPVVVQAEEVAPGPSEPGQALPEAEQNAGPVVEAVTEVHTAPADAVAIPGACAEPVAAAPAAGAETVPPAVPDGEADKPAEAAHDGTPLADPRAASAEPVAADAVPATGEPVAAELAAPLGESVPVGEDAQAGDGTPEPFADPAQRPAADGYDPAVREAVHRVIRERRDIRNGFRKDPIPHEVLLRVLEAAHTAPSVGHSQPWDFVVIRSAKTREKMHELAMQQREAYAKSLPKGRAKQFRELKIEAILDTPVNIVVTADPTRGGRHTLGRHTQPQMAPYSSALAVENLWLAARAEGLGVGWVSFFDEREMVRELGLPEHLEVVAYLCIGYVDEFPEEPELMQAGWSQRRPLSWVVHEEEYGNRALPGEEPHDLLEETLRGIRPLDAKALGEAWERQKRMTKPAGALGMLEIISAQLSGLSRQCPPPIPEPAAVAIFAGDHGVHAQGVTAWPQEVTAQMVANFLGGGAVCNAFANQVGAEVCVIDVGVAAELPSTPGLLPRKVRNGTDDFTVGPAMTREDVHRAIEVGIETARDLVSAGNKALLTGEMGIANTTTSAALIAVYTGADPNEVTGRGTGINDEMHARKVDVVRRALELHRPDPADPIGVLAAIGGLEHAAMTGLLLGAAALRTPVILDGVSAGAAALVARAIAPEVLAACVAGHRSAEPGHLAALTKLGLRPLVDLDLRLGEGTGALLALPLVQSAARVMHEVATFDSAGVTEKG